MIELRNVSKVFENIVAVDKINLKIEEQTIFGLLGPNGAGKTTTIRMINQILGIDEGEILFGGEKLKPSHTEKIGYMPEERGLYTQMKVGEHLMFLAELKGLSHKTAKEKIKKWMEKFKIEDWWNKKIIELSKGMQQKIQFIATILHEPPLLILDEPFTGLDPINTQLIKDEIRLMKDKGVTIIFSTHRMEQVEEICEDIALINKGKIILHGEIQELKQQFKKNHFSISYTGEFKEELPFKVVSHKNHTYLLEAENEEQSNEMLLYFMKRVNVKAFREELPSINEIFIDQVQGVSHE
jgi:ABC-2 type transport system ATP-binding protein